jgi:hypothetical protein
LYSKEELQDLIGSDFSEIHIEKVYREVNEGTYHNGAAATIQLRAVK